MPVDNCKNIIPLVRISKIKGGKINQINGFFLTVKRRRTSLFTAFYLPLKRNTSHLLWFPSGTALPEVLWLWHWKSSSIFPLNLILAIIFLQQRNTAQRGKCQEAKNNKETFESYLCLDSQHWARQLLLLPQEFLLIHRDKKNWWQLRAGKRNWLLLCRKPKKQHKPALVHTYSMVARNNKVILMCD